MVFNSKFEIGDKVFFIKNSRIAYGVVVSIGMRHYPSMGWKGPSFKYFFEDSQDYVMENYCFKSKAELVSNLLGEGGENER